MARFSFSHFGTRERQKTEITDRVLTPTAPRDDDMSFASDEISKQVQKLIDLENPAPEPHTAQTENLDKKTWSISMDGLTFKHGRPFAVEIFCGSGRLTRHLRAAGLDAVGIDWKGCKLIQETPAVVRLNLSLEVDQRKMWALLEHPCLTFVFLAPPCRTASRAREIRMIKEEHGPPPLRSEEEPLGSRCWPCAF